MFATFIGRRTTALATTLAVVIGLAITPALAATAEEGDDLVVAEPGTSEVLPETTPPAEPVVEQPAELPVEQPTVAAPAEELPFDQQTVPGDAPTLLAPQLQMGSNAPDAPPFENAVTILTESIDPVVVGHAFNQQLLADQPTGWSAANPNSSGLTVSPEGVVGGTIDRAGEYTLTVVVDGPGKSNRKTFQIIVQPEVTTSQLADATVGQAYSQNVATTSQSGQVVSFQIDRILPRGLTFDASTGHIYSAAVGAIPTNPETVYFNVRSYVDTIASAWKSLSITIGYPQPVVTTTTLPTATVGVTYSATLNATPGTSFTWSATGLPGNLALDPVTGVISGTVAYDAGYGSSVTVPVTVTANNGSASTPKVLSLKVLTPAPVLDPADLPDATVGVSYNHQLTSKKVFGVVEYNLAGGTTLPAGLQLSEDGLIYGSPDYNAAAGASASFDFKVRVTGTAGGTTRAFSITLKTPAPILDRANLPDATVDVFYNHQLTVKKAFGVLEYNLAGGTTLPAGMHLSQSGLIYGSPEYDSAAGASASFDFKVRVTGTAGGTTRAFSITVLTPAPIIETDVLATGWLKQPYSHTISTTGPGVILTVENLPDSLTFDGTTISGKSLTAGTFSVKVTATNAAGSVTEWIPLTINDKPALTAKAPVTVETGTLYEFTPGVTGESVARTLAADAPVGMAIDQNGIIRWTPSAAGFYEYWVTATNPAGVVTKRYTVRVLDRPLLTLGALDDGVLGMPYQQDLAHDGTDVRFTVIAGALPTGMALTQDGSLEGTPEEAGAFDFRVRAINGVGVDYDWFTLTVLEPAVTLSATDVIRGNTLTVTGSGYLPGDDLELWLNSTPVLLGTVTATGGTFTSTVVIPASTEAGAHHLVVKGTHSGTLSMPLTVVAPPVPQSTIPPSTPSTTQSTTQSRSPQLTVTPAEVTAEVTDVATEDEADADETEEAAEDLPTLNKPEADGETTAAVPADRAGLIMAAFVLLLAALLVWFLLWRRRRAES